jgi:hypothetical protein
MKNLLIGLLALASFSAFSDDLSGLNCTTDYTIHIETRNPYPTSRVIVRKNLLGGRSVLGYTPINSDVQNFKEEFNLTDSDEAIIYSFDVQEETSILSVKLKTNGKEVVLLDNRHFRTKEGFSGRISFFDLLQLGDQQTTNVVVTCLPAYK